MPKQLLASLLSPSLRNGEPLSALSPTQRRQRLNELSNELLDCERKEEALVTILLSNGASVARRGYADPRALLSVRIATDEETESEPPPAGSDHAAGAAADGQAAVFGREMGAA